MGIFDFWDNLPIVGSYFAGMPRFVKFILTAILILVILVGIGKLLSPGKQGGGSEVKEKPERPKAKPERHEHRHHRHEEKKEEAEKSEETGEIGTEEIGGGPLFEEETNTGDLGLLAGGEEETGQTSIESLLAGKPVIPEEEEEKKVEKKMEKQVKPKKKEKMPESGGPIGLPESLEEELEKEEHKEKATQKPSGKPVEFEEIKLPSKREMEKQKRQKPVPEKKPGKPGILGILGKKKETKKLTGLDIMKMLDDNKKESEIISKLTSSGMTHGKARETYTKAYKIWKEKRDPLIQEKRELEEQKKLIQYKYLKMQIDEDTFKKMMTNIQKKLVDVEAKLKSSDRFFKNLV